MIIEHQDAFEAEIAAIAVASIERERAAEDARRERIAREGRLLAEAARAASLTVFERGQRRA